MYYWNAYPFVRFTAIFILGILCFEHQPNLWSWPFGISLCLFACQLVGVILAQKHSFYKLRHLNGIITLGMLFFLGGWFTQLRYHNHPASHYTKLNATIKGFSGSITSPLNERKNHYRYDFELKRIFTSDSMLTTTGTIHLYIRKDSTAEKLRYGDELLVYGRFYTVPGPDNPNEFDYQTYLRRQDIYSHAFVKWTDVRVEQNEPPNRFLAWAYDLRTRASETIDRYIPASRENGIAKALLLGIKDHLDNEVKEAYSAAGAMHVLAVSGLHVGIIYLIIRIVFGKLTDSGRWGKYVFGIVSVSIIWLYAAMTGLSPSVLRAATMFSFVAIGQVSVREGNIYNTLALAAFVLLLFDPYLIYSVGFQLSFAAVIGIVYLQPKLYHLINIRFSLLDKAWAITCVSIAAQLATFPLTAYYFHQFPTYFLASNLVVIPASFLMLVGGMAMLLIDPIWSSAGAFIGHWVGQFIWLINEIIGVVHILPNSLIKWIYLDQVGLLLTYMIVFTFIGGLHFRAFKTLLVSAMLGLCFMCWNAYTYHQQAKKHELIFYEISDKIAFDYVSGLQATLFIDEYEESEMELLSYQIDPHRLASHLSPIAASITDFKTAGFMQNDAVHYGQVAGKRFIIFDSTTFHLDFKQVIETDFIVINNQSVKSLKWLKDHFLFEQLIVSSKNSFYYVRNLQDQAKELDMTIHSLKGDGALRISLEKGIKKERTPLPALFTTNPD